jgi:SAM-dependent methyltransferase
MNNEATAAVPAVEHWEQTYTRKRPDEVSWFQPSAERSLALIEAIAPDRASAIIDVGGGASRLVDGLLAAGYRELSVLDLSASALRASRERLGASGDSIPWIVGDITEVLLPKTYAVWHDRAVFHFLIEAGQRARYVANATRSIADGGHLVIATFAPDGPLKCSGLEVRRYDAEGLAREFGERFELLKTERETHRTPAGGEQKFVYCVFRKKAMP